MWVNIKKKQLTCPVQKKLRICKQHPANKDFVKPTRTLNKTISDGGITVLTFEMIIKFHQAHKTHRSIMKTSWKNPANILRTSREHLENIKRTPIEYLEKIQKNL